MQNTQLTAENPTKPPYLTSDVGKFVNTAWDIHSNNIKSINKQFETKTRARLNVLKRVNVTCL